MANDLWRTPPEVFYTLNKEFDFVADMASSNENKLCELNFTEEDDSLSFDWANHFSYSTKTKYVWLNCPYSNPMPWVKIAAEAQQNGLGAVMLLNNDTSVGWFAEALKTVSEIRYVIADKKERGGYSSGRLDFINKDGVPEKGNNKPQVVFVFNPFKVGARVTSYITKNELYGA